MQTGRPLRFLGGVIAGWTMLRVWLLWPTIGSVPALIHAVAPEAVAAVRPRTPPVRPSQPVVIARVAPTPSGFGVARHSASVRPVGGSPPSEQRGTPERRELALASASLLRFGDPVPPARGQPLMLDLGPIRPGGARLSGSAWVLVRGGGGRSSSLTAGQLGGAQAGLRLAYALDPARRLALAARLSAPLRERGLEGAVGLAWRPTRLPVTLVAEQRIGLDHARGGPTLGVIGGVDPTPVAAGFRLEAYGQAGAILRDGVELFADGAARLARPLTGGPVRVDLGAGAWGGAQRGARRLDIGPSLGVVLPVARHQLRLTLDWRERVLGDARPGSGAALTLGTDF